MEEVFRGGIHLCANRVSIFDRAVCVYVCLFLSECFCDKANKEKEFGRDGGEVRGHRVE